MSDLMKEIGERIKHYRKAKGMTQKELGEKVGCHEGTIRQYENGLREPRKVSKLAIARALDVSYDRLFSQKDGTNLAEVGRDCISRQAAISAICNACGKIDCDKMDKCEKLQLPPANCSEIPNNSDTISRQAAIDYFVTNVGFHDEDGYPIEDECELREIWTGYFDGIPSAQTEPLKIDLSGYSEEDWERLKKEWGNTPITVLSAQPKRGRWIKYEQEFMLEGSLGTVQKTVRECSVCTAKIAGMVGIMNFCPNCGAKMEGADDE